MKKAQRVGAILKILSDAPNKTFKLQHFGQMLDAAKSSISEDVQSAKQLLNEMELGDVITISGPAGGVKYVPYISDKATLVLQEELCQLLNDSSRIIGGGFLYISDIMSNTPLIKQVATIFSRKFQDTPADYLVTIETKGIPLAVMISYLLNIPLVVIRREAKISEGSTVSINYFSGTNGRTQKMSISKRAVVPGSKAIIVDDFMRGGSSIKGISEILAEFDVEVVGVGVMMTNIDPVKKKVDDFVSLLYIDEMDENKKTVKIYPNYQIF